MIGYVFSLGLIAYGVISWHRSRVSRGKRGMDSWYFIGLSFLVAVIAIMATGYGIGLRAGAIALQPPATSPLTGASGAPPTPVPLPIAQEPPTIPTITYTERDIREMLDALADAHDLFSKQITPFMHSLTITTENWRGALSNQDAPTFANSLKNMQQNLQELVWRPVNKFIYETHSGYTPQLRAALALDHEAARGESSRALQAA